MKSELSNTYIVYKHTSPSNKVYIGMTGLDINSRWANGFGYLTQEYFFRAIVKYGWINFKHEILFDGLTKEEAEEKEIELIAKYHATDIHYGYNIDEGGNRHLVSKETREKIKQSKTGKTWSFFQRESINNALDTKVGRKVLKYKDGTLVETFNNVRMAAKDAGYSTEGMRSKLNRKEETIINNYLYKYEIPKSFKSIPLDDRNYVTRAVAVYDLSYNLIGEYKSIALAARDLNINKPSHVHDVCSGLRKLAHGYIWRYKI